MKFFPSLLLSLIFVSVVSAQLTWTGTWTSTCNSTNYSSRNCYGGYLSLCTEGTNIFGTYSNIGHINGTTSGRVATGTWREAGFTDNNSGGFFWQLNSNTENIRFTGYYWYDNEPCVTYTWNGRLYDPIVDESKCLTVVEDKIPTIEGHWQAGVLNAGIDDLYICIDESKTHYYASSFINPQGYNTYSYGKVSVDDGKIGQGSAFYNFGSFYNAITYIVLSGPNTLVTLNYQVDSVEDAGLSYDSTPKEQITWTRVGGVSPSQCSNYRNLAEINWQGSWTDSRNGNGRFYTCVQGTQSGLSVSGVYSEFGYVTGVVSDDGYTLAGEFYDSGNNGPHGEFNITIADDGFSFSGYYAYSTSLNNRIPWNEQRVDITNNQIAPCWLESTSPSSSADGTWTVDFYGNFLDLCVKGDTFTASYEFGNTSTPGYIEGTTKNGKSLQATFYEEAFTNIGIIRYTDQGLVVSIWDQPIASPFYEPCTDATKNPSFGHQQGLLERSPYEKNSCSRNAYLKSGNFPESSSANFIFPSIAVILLCIVALF